METSLIYIYKNGNYFSHTYINMEASLIYIYKNGNKAIGLKKKLISCVIMEFKSQ